MDLPVEKLVGIFDRIKLFQFQSSPNLDDYKIWANTPKELERLKIAQDFLEIMGKLQTQVMFSNVLMAPVKRDVNTAKAIVNHHWVKQR
jgi:hypothetical protein